jgi:hypothetical protein
MQHDFVVPLDQPRTATGNGGDGWRDDVFQRHHAWRTDDLMVAAGLVDQARRLGAFTEH